MENKFYTMMTDSDKTVGTLMIPFVDIKLTIRKYITIPSAFFVDFLIVGSNKGSDKVGFVEHLILSKVFLEFLRGLCSAYQLEYLPLPCTLCKLPLLSKPATTEYYHILCNASLLHIKKLIDCVDIHIVTTS